MKGNRMQHIHLSKLTFIISLAVLLIACKKADLEAPKYGFLSLEGSAFTVAESATSINLNVIRTAGNADDNSDKLDNKSVSLDYSIVAGSATADSDYNVVSGTLTWSDGSRETQVVSIPIIDDTSDESDETFTLLLNNVTGGASLGISTALITITDDDEPVLTSSLQFHSEWSVSDTAYFLYSFDPVAPTSVTAIIDSNSNVKMKHAINVEGGIYNSSTQQVSQRHLDSLIIVGTDNKLYKLNAKTNSDISLQQISSESAIAADQCYLDVISDYANLANTKIIYGQQSFGDCNEPDASNFKYITLGMDNLSDPVSIAVKPLTAIYDETDASIKAYLVADGITLYQTDSSFQNPSSSASLATNEIALLRHVTASHVFLLAIDTLSGAYRLVAYDLTNNTISEVQALSAYNTQGVVSADGSNLYFSDDNIIYRVAMTPSLGTAEVVITDNNMRINNVYASSSHIVYDGYNPSATDQKFLRSISNSASNQTEANATTIVDTSLGLIEMQTVTAAGRMYYNIKNSGSNTAIAGVALVDGSDTQETNLAYWAGVSYSNQFNLYSQRSLVPFVYNSIPVNSLILVDGLNAADASSASRPLTSYNPSDHSIIANLGTLASDIWKLTLTGNNHIYVGRGWPATGTDILFVDANTAGSLARATTGAVNHDPIYLK